jgi:hypothetical protein
VIWEIRAWAPMGSGRLRLRHPPESCGAERARSRAPGAAVHPCLPHATRHAEHSPRPGAARGSAAWCPPSGQLSSLPHFAAAGRIALLKDRDRPPHTSRVTWPTMSPATKRPPPGTGRTGHTEDASVTARPLRSHSPGPQGRGCRPSGHAESSALPAHIFMRYLACTFVV